MNTNTNIYSDHSPTCVDCLYGRTHDVERPPAIFEPHGVANLHRHLVDDHAVLDLDDSVVHGSDADIHRRLHGMRAPTLTCNGEPGHARPGCGREIEVETDLEPWTYEGVKRAYIVFHPGCGWRSARVEDEVYSTHSFACVACQRGDTHDDETR